MELKVSYSGVIVKSIIGIIIAFTVAVPRILNNNDFFSFIYTSNIFLNLITVTITMVVLGAIWYFLYKSLRKDKGFIMNWLIFIITMIMLGLLLANAIIVAIGWISLYGNIGYIEILSALKLAAGGTFIAVLTGVLILPRLTLTEGKIKIVKNIITVVIALMFAQFIIYLISIILYLFNINYMINLYGSLFYGTSLFSIGLSLLASFVAMIFFLGILAYAKSLIGVEEKHYEFYIAAVLVNGIIRIYIELFKVILKIFARKQRR